MSSKYAELAKQRRENLKQQGLCIDCGNKPAQINRSRCNHCIKLSREANKRYRENNSDKIIVRRKDWYSNGKFGHITRASQKKQRLLLRKK